MVPALLASALLALVVEQGPGQALEPAAVAPGLAVAPRVVAAVQGLAPELELELAQVVAPRVLGLVQEPVVAEPPRNKTNKEYFPYEEPSANHCYGIDHSYTFSTCLGTGHNDQSEHGRGWHYRCCRYYSGRHHQRYIDRYRNDEQPGNDERFYDGHEW